MNLVCKIFGHKKIVRDWYPTDPVSSIACMRCGKVLKASINPTYTGYIGNNNKPLKMVCVNNDKINLTKNKVYEILYYRYPDYFIKDDSGEVWNFAIDRFESIIKNRKRKLMKLNNK